MTNINDMLNELAEYTALLEETKAVIAALQDEVKAYMADNNLDEVLSETGHKATFRQVVSNRFDSTTMKKDLPDVYAMYLKQTTYKRFTFAE